jgi:glycerate kinase
LKLVFAPASLKGVLSASEAAAVLARGAREAGADALELPIADGGEGTASILYSALGGEWRQTEVEDPLGRSVLAHWLLLPDGTAVIESAEAVGLPLLAPEERDPLRASTRGLGLLVRAVLAERPRRLLVTLGGSATVDGGRGLREVVKRVSLPLQVICDVRSPLLGERGAARAFGPQKGASEEDVEELERRLATDAALAPYAELDGAGAAGGLGAAFAALGGTLERGSTLVLELIRFRERIAGADLVVTGEGCVDRTTAEGKAPAEAARVAAASRIRCVVFGGLVKEPLPGVETVALSGDPERALDDLVLLGRRLASQPTLS